MEQDYLRERERSEMFHKNLWDEPPVVTEPPAATAEVAAQPQGNGNPEGEDDDELLISLEVHSTPEEGSPRE
jgi:hypothetical protein